MIKRLLQVGLVLAGFASMPSWAIFISDTTAGALDGADVGVVDTFVSATTEILGSPASEETWVNSVISDTFEYTITTEDVAYFYTDVIDVFAFELAAATEPDYYLIKNSTVSALFTNLADLNWGVFDVSLIVDIDGNVIDMNIPTSGFTISHVTQSVPEPGMVGLLAIGLLGMVVTRRRMKV